jgi:hypothetical protein
MLNGENIMEETPLSIRIKWNESVDHVIVYEFSDPWTWDEFVRAFEIELEMGETINSARYDVIVDVLNVKRVPGGSGITQVYTTFKRSPTNSGIAVILTESKFIISMFNVMKRVYPETESNYLIAPDYHAAHELIQNVRQHES